MSFDLVIFDFDGVLVDSEILACRVWADYLTELGFPVSLKDMVTKYTGQTVTQVKQKLETRFLRNLPDDFLPVTNQKVEDLFRDELIPVDGASSFIEKLSCPYCIASGSTERVIGDCLKYTGLDKHISLDVVFSAWNVPHGKPAPDVFLLAAQKMNTAPEKCLVIEDSVAGVTAGKAAGMTVFGFCAGTHCQKDHAQLLKQAGADKTFASFKEMADFLF